MTEDNLRAFWLDFAKRYCNQEFQEGSLPLALELFLESKVKSHRENKQVQSEKLSDMSLTYFHDDLSAEDYRILNSMRKLRSP